MCKLKHLRVGDWPIADHEAFNIAYKPGDVFDENRGPGAHHSEGWRRMILTTYRRWLGFLTTHDPTDLLKLPADRITPQRLRDFIDHIDLEVRPTTVFMGSPISITLHALLPRRRIGVGWRQSKRAFLRVRNARIGSIAWFLVGTRSISGWR